MPEDQKRCPSCGGTLECKLKNFSIGADGGGGLLSLLCDTYEVDLYACPQCGKVELYTSAFRPLSETLQEEPEPVVCPVCGAKHHPQIGCPTCALRQARSGNFSAPSDEVKPKKKERKPPWER